MENEMIVREEMSIDSSDTVSEPRAITPALWHFILEVAEDAYRSRMYKGINSRAAAAMAILKGMELGFGIAGSLEFIVPISTNSGTKYELRPIGALAKLHNSPLIQQVNVTRLKRQNGDFLGFETYIKRRDGFEYSTRFTMDDAERAGLIKDGSGWEKYPENMCLWRSVGFAADVAAPDICAGMTALLKMPEEYGVALSEQGEIIEDGVVEGEVKTENPPWNPTSVSQLIDEHGADAVMQALVKVTGGKMPSSDEELLEVAKELK